MFVSFGTNFSDFVAEDTLRKGDFVTLLGKPKGSFVATDAHSRRRKIIGVSLYSLVEI